MMQRVTAVIAVIARAEGHATFVLAVFTTDQAAGEFMMMSKEAELHRREGREVLCVDTDLDPEWV
jgi:hypothetical protein